MSKSVLIAAFLTASLSAIAWLYGYFSIGYGYYWRDFWFHVVTFLLPICLISIGAWILASPLIWRKIVGALLLVPAAVIWCIYLLLESNGFRIH